MMRWLFALCLLSACVQRTPPAATNIVTLTPTVPAALLHCAPMPAVPDASSQAVVAEYLVALWLTGTDCRAHLAAIAHLLSH